jgi:3-dehydroquinate synthase
MSRYFLKGRSTDVNFYTDLDHLSEDLDHKVFIIDEKLINSCGINFQMIVDKFPCFIIKASEKIKNFNTVSELYAFFQGNYVNRSTIIYGIGGGIVTDLAAFAASTYMRGCRLKLVPTTLLAMVDAAIGGKTAINFNNIKNNIGTFYPAEEIIVILDLLDTLTDSELLNGLAECIKMSLVQPSDLYELLLNSDRRIGENIIKKAIDLKFSICSLDPYDRKERRVLNLGHTFGHVIETLTDFTTSHGNAVALGIRASAYLSLSEGLIERSTFEKIEQILNKYDLPARLRLSKDEININKIRDILTQDKKSSYSNKKLETNVVVFNRFQQAVIQAFPIEKIYQALMKIVEN